MRCQIGSQRMISPMRLIDGTAHLLSFAACHPWLEQCILRRGKLLHKILSRNGYGLQRSCIYMYTDCWAYGDDSCNEQAMHNYSLLFLFQNKYDLCIEITVDRRTTLYASHPQTCKLRFYNSAIYASRLGRGNLHITPRATQDDHTTFDCLAVVHMPHLHG